VNVRREPPPLAALVQRGASQALERLSKISPLAWRLEPVDWDVPPQDALYMVPRGGTGLEKLFGSAFSMPGAAVLAVFSESTAASLTQNVLSSYGSTSMITETQAVGEISNILVNAIGGVLADACKFSFFLPAPDVFHATKTDLLEKLRHAVIQLQGPGQKPPNLSRVSLRSADFECVLLVLLGESWIEAVAKAKR